jgi:hypothetical protein
VASGGCRALRHWGDGIDHSFDGGIGWVLVHGVVLFGDNGLDLGTGTFLHSCNHFVHCYYGGFGRVLAVLLGG